MTGKPTPRDRRLAAELEQMRRLAQDSSFFHFAEAGERFPPEEYQVTFRCKGIVHKPEPPMQTIAQCVGESHEVHIYLPASYPLQPPQICLMTPVFHPNIKYLVDWENDIQAQLGGADVMKRALAMRPELQEEIRLARSRLICLDGIKAPEDRGNYVPRLTLYDICRELGEMIMLQRYNLESPLDEGAWKWTTWAKRQNLLPIDGRPFLNKLKQPDTDSEAIEVIVQPETVSAPQD
jgi:ubiquitin-protein ligase